MTSRLLTRSIAILTLSCAAILAAAQDTKPSAPAPVFKVGDSWKYLTQDLGAKADPTWYSNVVTTADDKQTVLLGAMPPDRRFWWIYDNSTARFTMRFDFDEAAPDKRGAKARDNSGSDSTVQFPLQVGKKYPVKEKWVNSTGANGDSDLTAEVTAFEKIKVQAGEFEVYKIEVAGWWNNRRFSTSGRQTSTIWYAPAVKRWVKYEFKDYAQGRLSNHRTEELLEYKLGE